MFIFSVSKVQTLMSNLRSCIRNGFSTYFCITNEQVLSLNFSHVNLGYGLIELGDYVYSFYFGLYYYLAYFISLAYLFYLSFFSIVLS
jgi:hypothetical protein